jgi:hypothetical protein
MQTERIIVAAIALVAGCSRYEWRNELDVPGMCDDARQATHATVPRRVRLESAPPSAQLRGHVSRRESSEPLSQALVRLTDGYTRRAVQTDSAGLFVIDSVLPGRYTIQVLRVGFRALRDTIEVTADNGAPFEISLDVAVVDGPCSGFAAVRVRKPWWKVW